MFIPGVLQVYYFEFQFPLPEAGDALEKNGGRINGFGGKCLEDEMK